MSKARVDINLLLPSKDEKRRDPNWPNILVDDDYPLSELRFSIYDGATTAAWKKVQDDCDYRGSWAAGTSYSEKDIVIDYGGLYVTKSNHISDTENQPGFDNGQFWRHVADGVTYDAAGWVDDKDYAAKIFLVKDSTGWLSTAAHHSEDGYNDPGEWQDSDYLSGGDVELKDSKTYDVETKDKYENHICGACSNWSAALPHHWIYRIISNNMEADADAIEDEWDSNNEFRFLRKPLGFVDTRDSDGRWTMEGQQNIRIRLKTAEGEDPKFDISPDLDVDDETEGSYRIAIGETGERPGVLVCKRPSKKYHLQVNEVGTGSIANYIEHVWAVDPNDIEINTSWDFLDCGGIFWCPFDTSDTTNFKVTTEPRYDADEYTGPIIPHFGRRKAQLYLMPRTWAFYCRNWQYKTVDGPDITCKCGVNEITGAPCTYWDDVPTKSETYAHHIGIWFDRFPHDFILGEPGIDEGTPLILASPGPSTWYTTEGDAPKDVAVQNATSAGLDADEVLSGTNGLHVFLWIGDDTIYAPLTVRLRYASCLDAWGKEPLFWSRANLKVCDTTPVCGAEGLPDFQRECITASDDMWTPAWTKITKSDFWDKYGIGGSSLLSGYSSTADDEIPYGVGLAPTPAGGLVGVVRAGRIFYIWRKTDESISTARRDDVAEQPDQPYGFEHSLETHFWGVQSAPFGFDWPCTTTIATPFPMSPFNVQNGREITGALRPLPSPIEEGEADDFAKGEEYAFTRSFFVMGGRQRYILDGEWAWRHTDCSLDPGFRTPLQRNKR